MIDIIKLAEKIIFESFVGKTDKGGNKYTDHLYRVKDFALKEWNNAPCEFICAALLHYLLEDCPEWNITSLSCLFPEDVISTVSILTRLENEPYMDYISRIKKHGWATMIKIADLTDNMDIRRLKEITEADFKRLQKYHLAYLTLTEK